MHLGKFHALIAKINEEYFDKQINSKLQNVIAHLDAIAANPGNTDVAAAFKAQIDDLRNSLASSSLNRPYPTLAALINSIGARKYIGDRLFSRIEDTIQRNSMTAQLAATELRTLVTAIDKFYAQIRAIDEAFTNLQVEFEDIEPGEGEIGISIPEPAGERLLSDLAATAKAWHKALRPFVELADPDHNPIVVRTISSSDWQFYLASVPAVYLALSAAIGQINELLQKLIVTRKLISQLTEAGIQATSTAVITAEADNMLEQGTRALAEKIVDNNKPTDTGRANELKTELNASLKFLARELAKNVTIEVRYIAPTSPDAAQKLGDEDDNFEHVQNLNETAAQIERNMDLARLDSQASEILNLPPPDDEND